MRDKYSRIEKKSRKKNQEMGNVNKILSKNE
jgi:hypothetical protein